MTLRHSDSRSLEASVRAIHDSCYATGNNIDRTMTRNRSSSLLNREQAGKLVIQQLATGGYHGMTKHSFQFLFFAGILAGTAMLSCHRSMAKEPGASRPQMVICLFDDHTWRDSSAYDSPDINTTNMQRLADAGMTLHKAYAALPSCEESRAVLLTGIYPAKIGAQANQPLPRADLKKLPAYLQSLGYEVESFGNVAHNRHTTEYGFDAARHLTFHDDVAVEKTIHWLPKMLDVARAIPPNNIDNQSNLPVLMGKTTKHRDVIFTKHSGDVNLHGFPIRAASTADGWKYIRNPRPEFRFNSHVTNTVADNGYWPSWVEAATKDDDAKRIVQRYHYRASEELYNTSVDPYEQNNLIDEAEHQQQLAKLRDHLNRWMTQTQDPQTVFGQPQKAPRPGQPNMITVFIDDMGWGDLSCYGGKRVATRNIDRLASEGLRFTQFYVNSPICSPSRVALSTGQYPQRHQITSYLANRQQNNDRGMAQWLDPKAPMLARQLQLSGYATGHFGKWHMGGQRDVGDAPLIQEYGFDRSLTNFEGLGPRVLPLKDAYDGQPPVKHDLGSAALGKGPIRWEDRSQITTAFVDEAIAFVDRAKATNQPFFINLWPDDVHSPFFPPRVLREQTDGSKRQLYYSVMDAMDQQLGKLFDRVRDDPNLRDNTLIVVM
ncbi:MAG TPA: hypothetical protein DDZ51_09670, partial [Planctomycetaceae bacterium]|nr:hypothetical protein [Planctomycetaceae bacterium]